MKRKKLSKEDAERDMENMHQQRKSKRKITNFSGRDLIKYLAEILLWANAKKGSKQNVTDKVNAKFNIKIKPDQIYRFVKKHNAGVWPHARKSKGEKSP